MKSTPGRFTVWLALAACGLAALVVRASAAPDEPSNYQAIMTSTKQNAFTIPFRIEPPQTPAEAPVEIQLHVSANQGQTWDLSSRVKPEAAGFIYRAPHDGEYWYSIRTVDKQGISRPETPLQPQLIVNVDTIAPRLDLSARRGEAGEIIARWQAVDPHLKPYSFKLEYQTNAAGPWERVSVDDAPGAMKHTQSGETTWWPKEGSTSITVRATISDMAGNPAVSQQTVKIEGVLNSLARSTPRDPSIPPERDKTADSTPWRADTSSSGALSRMGRPDDGLAGQGGSGPGPRVQAQPVGQSYTKGTEPGGLDFGKLGTGERPRMVNSRSFELEYEVESVGSSGIGKVELWGTRDGGRTWSIFGVDNDNHSPIRVSVDGEGVYGFRIVVQSGSGYGGRAPVQGDLPEIWIGVDLTKPVARITDTEVSTDGGELTVRWEASDEAPDPRPISLAFSGSAHGPWTPIASGLENTGSYHWRLEDRVPDRVYLRLEVRDEAGNVAQFELTEPIARDRQRPEGRIRGVRPVGQVDRDASRVQ